MLTVRGFPQSASHAQWWPWQWMATQCDCEVIVPEDGSTVQNCVHIFYLKQDVAKVAFAFSPQYIYIYWLLYLKFIFKTWEERGKNTTAWHERLRWQTTVMESILLNHLTSTQQLIKKKKRQNQDASVRLPETTEGRTTEVRAAKRSLTTSATSRSCAWLSGLVVTCLPVVFVLAARE